MKIFVSYSRKDADFAQHLYEYFNEFGYDIFTDIHNIQIGTIWSNIIEYNISNCNIFVVILTHSSIRSQEVEKEVLQAQRENKTIIPCIHRSIKTDEIKWDLNKRQGLLFDDKYELARNLYSKIRNAQPPKPRKPPEHSKPPEHPNYRLKIIIPIIVVIGIVAVIGIVISFGNPGKDTPIRNVIAPPILNTSQLTNNTNKKSTSNIIYSAVNNPPIAIDESNITTNINQPIGIQLKGMDKDINDELTALIVSLPTNGRLGNINQTTGIVTYFPNTGFNGNDKFTFKVNDGKVDSNNLGLVSINVK